MAWAPGDLTLHVRVMGASFTLPSVTKCDSRRALGPQFPNFATAVRPSSWSRLGAPGDHLAVSKSKSDVWLGGVCGELGEHTPLPGLEEAAPVRPPGGGLHRLGEGQQQV